MEFSSGIGSVWDGVVRKFSTIGDSSLRWVGSRCRKGQFERLFRAEMPDSYTSAHPSPRPGTPADRADSTRLRGIQWAARPRCAGASSGRGEESKMRSSAPRWATLMGLDDAPDSCVQRWPFTGRSKVAQAKAGRAYPGADRAGLRIVIRGGSSSSEPGLRACDSPRSTPRPHRLAGTGGCNRGIGPQNLPGLDVTLAVRSALQPLGSGSCAAGRIRSHNADIAECWG